MWKAAFWRRGGENTKETGAEGPGLLHDYHAPFGLKHAEGKVLSRPEKFSGAVAISGGGASLSRRPSGQCDASIPLRINASACGAFRVALPAATRRTLTRRPE